MDLPPLRKCLQFSRRNKNHILLIAFFAASGYGAYKAYNSPYVARKRRRLANLLRAFVSQLSKIAASKEFSSSLARVSEAVTIGILLGFSKSQAGNDNDCHTPFDITVDRVLEKLFSKAGTGFASVVVGSFAKNLVLGFFDGDKENARSQSDVPRWVNVICDERCGRAIGDWVQIFVSTAVAVFLDKTMDVNTYDEMFAGMSNPRHQEKVKGILVAMCNGAVETFVRTSHQVLTNPSVRVGSSVGGVQDYGWIEQIKSTLSVPANRRFMLDVTGRVTFETVRSFVVFLLWRISDGCKRSVSKVHDEVVDKGMEVVRYVGAKSSVILTLCLALYLHIVGGSRILLPA
uniref:Protein PHLOEM PROTEIN 2-LIKE A10 n=1 Tax=Cajanus cajan TaxID=3821 RepID=A0A151RA11_CAJCA|nr:Protein PHLOEM PROTEIN 2-LIKE A10 [Cajanus cajan]